MANEKKHSMKHVLVIIESPFFREYLCEKLEEKGVDVSSSISFLDITSKMRNNPPDLIILDHLENQQDFIKILKQKKLDINTANTPVIIFARKLEQKQLLELIPYNVKKIFNKPLKVDSLFAVFSEVLKIPFTIDENPGIIDVHVNENIIFIEITQGINEDKLDILRFKISELIDLYKIRVPKVIIMLSDTKLNADDTPRLQKLFYTVIETPIIKPGLIMVLTKDDFVLQYILTQKNYSNIRATSNLQNAMDTLWGHIYTGDDEQPDNKSERLGNMILKAKNSKNEEAVLLKFNSDEREASFEKMTDWMQNIRIAVIDDDFVIQELIKNTFRMTNAFVNTYSDGEEFLEVVDNNEFDLAFLDINMPKVDGLSVLKALQTRDIPYPIIVLSTVSQRETMIQAFQMGIKSYLIKPLKPEEIFMKSIEILKASF